MSRDPASTLGHGLEDQMGSSNTFYKHNNSGKYKNSSLRVCGALVCTKNECAESEMHSLIKLTLIACMQRKAKRTE